MGMVSNKYNFFYSWGRKEGAHEPKVWLHDLLKEDGTPYDQKEIEIIKKLTGKLSQIWKNNCGLNFNINYYKYEKQ